jgi:hypothetical protein
VAVLAVAGRAADSDAARDAFGLSAGSTRAPASWVAEAVAPLAPCAPFAALAVFAAFVVALAAWRAAPFADACGAA